MNAQAVASILVVDDNPSDVELTREAFAQQRLPVSIAVAADGQAAVDYLRRVAADGALERPCFILLDINMPGINGFEVLTFVRTHPAFSTMPVLMLTTSSSPGDRARALAGGATEYLVKPRRFGDLLAMVDGMRSYLPSA
ncbi:MAG: response regulator [Planctomycetes bacterium]|nr:response regulator [Planctomycetota bacterium]